MASTAVWKDEMTFDVELHGHHFLIDADEAVGGRNLGPRPKGLTLSSLAGCTGMDVISILKKMRQDVTAFEVTADGKTADEHPKKYVSIVVTYRVEGNDLDPERVKRAVELSETRYCGVSAALKASAELSNEIYINGDKVD